MQPRGPCLPIQFHPAHPLSSPVPILPEAGFPGMPQVDVPGAGGHYLVASLQVMVWIHGGTLLSGAATSQDGSALAAYGDVVVVMIQYRLGLLGFLR